MLQYCGHPAQNRTLVRLKRIQRATTKLAPSLSELTYQERLTRLGLPTPEQKREK